jgi:DNA helicase II / ATP-dependent DNA helicase PcrA
LMVVGDPDQSIYAFRSADINNILDFSKDYPGAKVIRLEHNYRSTRTILEVANALITQNTQRLQKVLRPVKHSGEPVKLYRAPNAREEAAFVAREIAKMDNLQDIAILYRTNAQSRLFEEHLRRANIPVRLVGAVGFFERREIKDLLAYARVAVNPLDSIGLRRIVNTPTRGIGASTVAKLVEHAQKTGASVVDVFRSAEQLISRPQQVQAFIVLLDELIDAAYETGPSTFFERVIDATGFRDYLKQEQDGEDRLQNVEELLQAAREWEKEEGGTLADFLDSVALTAKAEEPQDVPEQSVTAMTLHNAKGLEFPIVFLVGLEENLLPHRNSLGRLEELEEERRLFYVGITRAGEQLYISHAEERDVYGKREYSRPSRFLEDIPLDLLKEVAAFGDTKVPTIARVAKPQTQLSEFRGGERVSHPKFGNGTVVAAMGSEVTVMFPGTGLKKLAIKFAGLKVL